MTNRQEIEDTAYMRGSRFAWTRMLQECLSQLGYDGTESEHTKWILERESTVHMLRGMCRQYGDNDWEDELHLADVVDKHLLSKRRR